MATQGENVFDDNSNHEGTLHHSVWTREEEFSGFKNCLICDESICEAVICATGGQKVHKTCRITDYIKRTPTIASNIRKKT